MMKVISTGSYGNSYILSCNNEKLLIDFGLPYKDILLNLDNADNTYGICSHYH